MRKRILHVPVFLLLTALLCGCADPSVAAPESTLPPISPTSASPTLKSAPTSALSDLVWFAPNFGSQGFVELFTQPGQWAEARSNVDVFQFYADNVIGEEPCSICGNNSLEAFIRVQAFQKLTEWSIAIGIELGPIYPDWDCSGDTVYGNAHKAIQNIHYSGGEAAFLSMDEPLMYGQLGINGKKCDYSVEETAAVTAHYIGRLASSHPDIAVGDIEPYPHFSVTELEDWILALEAQGVTPAFFYLDVDTERVRVEKRNVAVDLQTLEHFCNERGIPFGVIFTSNWTAAYSDKTYFNSAMEWAYTVNAAIGKPQHVIFQSWQGPASSGAHEVPANLPESDPGVFSHTRLILEGLEVFAP